MTGQYKSRVEQLQGLRPFWLQNYPKKSILHAYSTFCYILNKTLLLKGITSRETARYSRVGRSASSTFPNETVWLVAKIVSQLIQIDFFKSSNLTGYTGVRQSDTVLDLDSDSDSEPAAAAAGDESACQ